MTLEEQYAAIGKAHADLKAKTAKLRALELTAHGLGEQFIRLGNILSIDPHLAGLNQESVMNGDVVPTARWQMFDRKIFDADKFKQLTDDIRETMQAIETLTRKLA